MSTPGDIGLRRYSPDYEKDDLEAENRRLREAIDKIANCQTWRGRKNYGHTDADLGEYWSDLAKEFQEIARAALAAEPASGEAKCEIDREHHWRYRLNGTIAPCLYCGIPVPGAPPPPPTQGEEETARGLAFIELCRRADKDGLPYFQADGLADRYVAALRQRADEAARAENEACAQEADDYAQDGDVAALDIAAAIRARMAKP